ncbi:MAG: MBL fold metallo-hydrolase [Verrucomicrobia bacterium]|nr:MBL fold metallo-hydrolase [Verrucomicrobiota bacterium]
MILEVFPSGPAETNAYLIGCPQTLRAVVIDVPFESTEQILKRARELSLVIECILLTHSHWDHTAEVCLLKDALHIPVYVHQEDAGNLERPGSDRLPLFFPIKGVVPDGFLSDGQELMVGKLRIQVIHTPGHTPGGVCFYFPDEKALISGDTLFRGTIGNLSFPTARPALMWASLKRLAALPPDTKVYPGHGGPTTIHHEKWISQAQERFN